MSLRTSPGALQVLLHHEAVRALAEVADELGVESHLVGGVLRDRFLGLPSRDLDAVVSDRGREVGERLAERLGARLVHLGGKSFGAYRLVHRPAEEGDGGAGPASPAWVLDLWDREGTTLAADLARRDFTVDSIALSIPGGDLIDPHRGVADLRQRVLRATTPESFRGDPLRVLRLPRLLVQLPGFTVGSDTLDLARASAADLVAVASERVREELGVLFSLPEVSRGVAILSALGVYPGLWLGRPGEMVDEAGSGRIGRLCGQLSRLGATAIRLRELSTGGAGGRRGRPLGHPVRHRIARLALTFAHLPSSERRAPGAEAVPMGRAEALARSEEAGYLTRKDTAAIARLLPVEGLPADDLERRRFLHRLGDLASTAVCYAGVLRGDDPGARREWEESAAALAALYREEGEAIVSPPRLLDGRQVAALLGVGEGPAVGEALRKLRWAQVEGKVRTRAEAEQLVRGARTLHERPSREP